MRERTNGNEVNASGRDAPDRFQIHSPAGLEFYLSIPPKSNRFAHLGCFHIIEQNDVNFLDLNESTDPFETVRLDFHLHRRITQFGSPNRGRELDEVRLRNKM